MSARPEYLPLPHAILEAMERWYPQAFEELKAEGFRVSEATLMEAGILACRDDTLKRLWGCFSAGELAAYYHAGPFGWQAVPQNILSAPEGESAIRSGWYTPSPRHRQPSYQLHLLRSEFDALFAQTNATAAAGDAPAASSAPKKRFTEAMLPKLVVALQQHADKTRREQREIVRNLPEFANCSISAHYWRKAEKKAPRPIGRPSRD